MLGDWVIFFLALLLVPVLLLEETSTDPGVVGAATVANAVIWVLFALDYAVDLWRAPDRGAHVRVVFSAATGLMALDYRSGLTRALSSPPAPTHVLAVDTTGRFALVWTDSGIQIFERTGDELKMRPDLSFAAESILQPLGVFLP